MEQYRRDDRYGRNDRDNDSYSRDNQYDRYNTRARIEAINDIYRDILDRDGRRTWTDRLADGWSLDDVRDEIEDSDEARGRR